MKLVEKALLYKQRSSPVTWASYLTSLALPAWWRMRDTSGVTVVNSGSLGSAVDLTATAWTMAQAGQLGAGEAGLADGANTRLQCANNATLAGYTTWEWAFLVKPTNAGESSFGIFMSWGNGAVEKVNFISFNTSVASLFAGVHNTLDLQFLTTTSSGLSTSVFSLLFVSYDDSTDRKAHMRRGVSGAVTELGYSTQPAITGTYKIPTQTLNICNYANQTLTFNGLMDEVFFIGGRTFTAAERLQMTILAGV